MKYGMPPKSTKKGKDMPAKDVPIHKMPDGRMMTAAEMREKMKKNHK